MRKLGLLLTFVCLCACLQAQNVIDSVKSINFYGVDFTKVRTFQVDEDPNQVKCGLNQINFLFTSEMKKYNIEKYMGKKVITYQTDETVDRNAKIDESKLKCDSNHSELSEKDIQFIVKKVSSGDNNKTGLIFIAENIDKPNAKGTYQVVFFDEATKKIIYSKRVTGKAGGFGLRNFWAKSVLEVLKDWKY